MTESIQGYRLSYSSISYDTVMDLFSTMYHSPALYTIVVLCQGTGIDVPEQYEIVKHDGMIKGILVSQSYLRNKCVITGFSS